MQAVPQRRGGRDEAGEEVVVADLPGPGTDLFDRGPDLPDGGDVAVAGLGGQGLPHLLQGRLHRAEPGGDVAPGVLAVGRHQVEDRPDLLRLSADHAHPGGGDVRFVELDLQAEPLQHGLLRGVLALVARRGGVQRGDRAAQVSGLVGEAVRGVVAPGVVVARIPRKVAVSGYRWTLSSHERVGDGIDRSGSLDSRAGRHEPQRRRSVTVGRREIDRVEVQGSDRMHPAVRRIWAGLPPGTRAALSDLAPTDLQSLLIDLARLRAERVDAADLVRRWQSDRFVRSADVDPRLLPGSSRIVAALPDAFVGVELSPVAPLGTCAAVGPVDQNRIVTTIRTSEVVSDPTTCLPWRPLGVAGRPEGPAPLPRATV